MLLILWDCHTRWKRGSSRIRLGLWMIDGQINNFSVVDITWILSSKLWIRLLSFSGLICLCKLNQRGNKFFVEFSDVFEKQLLNSNSRRNTHNHPNPQSWGMDAFTTVIVRKAKNSREKDRTDKSCQVLMELSRFDNVCPQYEDRQLLRVLLGRGDDLRSSSYLLSPYDAARLSQSMLVLPQQEREVTVFKACHMGVPVSFYKKKKIFIRGKFPRLAL